MLARVQLAQISTEWVNKSATIFRQNEINSFSSLKDSDGNEFVFNGVKWVGYDSPERARAKVNFYQLVFFWSTYNTYGTMSIIDT